VKSDEDRPVVAAVEHEPADDDRHGSNPNRRADDGLLMGLDVLDSVLDGYGNLI